MISLPAGVTVLERGWLSSNCVVLRGQGQAALVDSGYCTHAPQTLALVRAALDGATLTELVNTHLHSDHCGGNAALQAEYPGLRTRIPPGQAQHVRDWDATALSYIPTGQDCPRFRIDGVIAPGETLRLGQHLWQAHAAPGHDPHALMLFEPQSRLLISGDALWERGFGVVFPELEGDNAFAEVAQSLDLIEQLQPLCVVPGHGSPFTHVKESLAAARSRLAQFVGSPHKHAAYAAKVLLKFRLLQEQRLPLSAVWTWASQTPYFHLVHQRYFASTPLADWLEQLVHDLTRSGAAVCFDGMLVNA